MFESIFDTTLGFIAGGGIGWIVLGFSAASKSPYAMAFGAVIIISCELSDISRKLEKIND